MATMPMKTIKASCINPKNLFCFVCGIYTKSHHKRSIITKPLRDAYEAFFVERTRKGNYEHGPPSVCNDCNNALMRWANQISPHPGLSFRVPMIWSKAENHKTDCYFCLTRSMNSVRRTGTFLNEPVLYPRDLKSAIRPRPDSAIGSQATTQGTRKSRSNAPHAVYPPALPPVPMGITVSTKLLKACPQRCSNVPDVVRSTRRRTTKQVGSMPVAGTKRKSFDLASNNTYGVTKIRLRSSEPSVVLEKCEKLLPPMGPSMSHVNLRSMTASTRIDPKITSVFSLNDEFPSYDSFTYPATPAIHPANGHESMPITIEIEDDDEEENAKKEVKQEPKLEQEQEQGQKPVQALKLELQQQAHVAKTEPKSRVGTIKVEQEQKPIESYQEPAAGFSGEKKPEPPLATEFININTLPISSSTPSSKMVVVKMATPRTPAPSVSSHTSAEELVARREPHFITQTELILLLRDLELTKEKSAILINRLKRWNLLAAQLVTPRAKLIPPPATAAGVGQRITTMSSMSLAAPSPGRLQGSLPQVITTHTGQRGVVPANLAPQLLQSNAITTSNNSQATPVNGVSVRRRQPTVGGATPAKPELMFSS